ncbi:MAG: hypothetical protein ETSY1_25750 [Candidatus Entotheonella factor]|uniref:MucR family transcriptional regulator n=1 Tax=Entotheonella factor TaxID=1429438 RepID=W4LF64_ENTF1|nr:MAG: hypothetical protein ETSY1_25750 [Candidatus Entotheonella factor]
MSQTILEMAKELVLAQVQAQQIAPEAMKDVLHSTYETLRGLEAAEAGGGPGVGNGAPAGLEAQAPVDWKGSISKNTIRCLECGESFKQLSLRHLSTHGLDPRSYREKYNIPRSQALSARSVTARRRELAQQIRPWELAPSKTQAEPAKAAAKPAASNGAAKPAATKPVARSRVKKAAAKA